MMRSASSSDHLVPRQVENAPLHVRASLCSTASILALAAAALCWSVEPVRAACTPTVTPTTGQIVTCNTNPPNPVTTAIVSTPGSTNVTINMLSGAQLNVSSDAVVLNAGGQINNNSGRHHPGDDRNQQHRPADYRQRRADHWDQRSGRRHQRRRQQYSH